uniref:hypothetical protein n=1 Tax=Trichocoleus desertorum TaxID=1481672 RepID=UPI0025B3F698|nr:hypothetical protein [Trichocoleus desertorum]
MMTLSGNRKISSPWAESDRALMQGDDHRGGGRVMPNLSESDSSPVQFDRAQIIQHLRNIANWMEQSPHLKFSEGIEVLAKEAARIEAQPSGGQQDD